MENVKKGLSFKKKNKIIEVLEVQNGIVKYSIRSIKTGEKKSKLAFVEEFEKKYKEFVDKETSKINTNKSEEATPRKKNIKKIRGLIIETNDLNGIDVPLRKPLADGTKTLHLFICEPENDEILVGKDIFDPEPVWYSTENCLKLVDTSFLEYLSIGAFDIEYDTEEDIKRKILVEFEKLK